MCLSNANIMPLFRSSKKIKVRPKIALAIKVIK